MSENWDDYAEGWNENPDVVDYSNRAFTTLSNIKDLNTLSVLDFGCGTGLLTEKMADEGASVVAVDPSEKMTQVLAAKNLKQVDVFTSEIDARFIEQHPSLHNAFDVIVASSVCAFLPDFNRTLDLLCKLLKPGGLFVQWDWAPTPGEPDFGFTPSMIKKAYNKAELTVLKAENAFTMGTAPDFMQVVMGVGKR